MLEKNINKYHLGNSRTERWWV